MFIKTDALKFFNIYRKTPSLESLFIKVAGLKGSSTQVYFRKHRERFRKSFFHGISLVAASEEKLLRSSTTILYFNECLKMIKIFYSGKYIPVWWYLNQGKFGIRKRFRIWKRISDFSIVPKFGNIADIFFAISKFSHDNGCKVAEK